MFTSLLTPSSKTSWHQQLTSPSRSKLKPDENISLPLPPPQRRSTMQCFTSYPFIPPTSPINPSSPALHPSLHTLTSPPTSLPPSHSTHKLYPTHKDTHHSTPLPLTPTSPPRPTSLTCSKHHACMQSDPAPRPRFCITTLSWLHPCLSTTFLRLSDPM